GANSAASLAGLMAVRSTQFGGGALVRARPETWRRGATSDQPKEARQMRNAGGVSVTRNRWRVGRMGVLSAAILVGFLSLGSQSVQAQAKDPVKVGILHSLSGTMAISEAPIKEVVLMAIDEINAAGGVMGRKVEPVVEDPASNWDLFAEKAKKLLQEDKVATVFGCWTSVSRKSVLPVFERYNGLLFYPVQYEGEECSKNVIYTGA